MTPKFQIFTGLLKAYEGDDGSKRFRTTASSTISDLAKDEIMVPAIEHMAQKAKGNMTIFLNHEYRVPEDVLGSCEDTAMHTRGVDSEGNPIVDLDFDIKLNDSNPRAVQTYDAIKSGVKLGTSIGAIVRQAEKKKGGGLRISELELLEASIVGIPANPRSWVQYAMKSINSIDEAESSSFIIDEESVLKDVEEALEKIAADQSEGELEIEKAMCKSCGHSAGCGCADCSCASSYHVQPQHGQPHKDAEPDLVKDILDTDVEPDKEASTVSVNVTVDSDSTQDASPSSPESVLMDEDRADTTVDGDSDEFHDDVTMAAELDVEPTEEAVLERFFATADFAAVVTKLQEVVKELTEKDVELRQTTAQRDDLKENLIVAKEIIDRIADLPVGRKTRFSGAISDFRRKFPQYDEEFVKFLEK